MTGSTPPECSGSGSTRLGLVGTGRFAHALRHDPILRALLRLQEDLLGRLTHTPSFTHAHRRERQLARLPPPSTGTGPCCRPPWLVPTP